MNKTLKIISTVILLLTIMTSCTSESQKNINELLNELNKNYGYDFKAEYFTIEKKENIIYHIMTDNNTLYSLYSNKNGEIIQCTLSSFDKNSKKNYNLLINTGVILTNQTQKDFSTFIKNAQEYGKYKKNGWTVVLISHTTADTFIINKSGNPINHNNRPTLKNNCSD